MICQKCGYQSDEQRDCPRCGLVYTRYRARDITDPLPRRFRTSSGGHRMWQTVSSLSRFYHIFRWAILAALIAILALILHDSPPPSIANIPNAAQRAEHKIKAFRSSMSRGPSKRLALDEPELNGWLNENMALKKPTYLAIGSQIPESLIASASKARAEHSKQNNPSTEKPQSVRDIRIALLENSLRLYMIVSVHGMDLSLELEGLPIIQNGYLRLEPSRGKLGSLPLMPGTLISIARRLFDSPENKEKFRVPPQLNDIRVEQRQFVVISR
jgi:hypothetical protein